MRRAAPVLCLMLAAVVGRGERALAAAWTQPEETIASSGTIQLTGDSGRSVVRLADGRLFAVWYERRAQNVAAVRGAFRETDGTWVAETSISLGDSLSVNPTVALTDDGVIHVAWEDRRDNNVEIYYRRRSAAGVWQPEERLTTNPATSSSPELAAGSAGRVHLVWSDGSTGNLEIHYRHRDPNGIWSPDIQLTDDRGASESPSMAVDRDGLIHVAWQDNILFPAAGESKYGNQEIYHLILDRDGNVVGSVDRVSRALGLSQNATVAAGPDGAVHVFWCDNRDRAPSNANEFPLAIWYRRWLPGYGFGHEKRFIYTEEDNRSPVAVCGRDGSVNLVWEDYTHGNGELYYRQITPEAGWDVAPTRLTETLGSTRGPGLCIDDDGTLHLIWSDSGTGNQPSIRYRAGRTDGTTPAPLQGLNLQWSGDGLHLTWRSGEDAGVIRYVVYAAAEAGAAGRRVAESDGGTAAYALLIPASTLGGASWVRLGGLFRDGHEEILATLPLPGRADAADARPLEVRPPYPNPAAGPVSLMFEASRPGRASLEILDVHGGRVGLRDLGYVGEGVTVTAWDGRRATGEPAAAGRYFARLILDGRAAAAQPFTLVH